MTAVAITLIAAGALLAADLPGSAAMSASEMKLRYESLEFPAVRALNSVKLDLVVEPPLPTAKIEAAIRVWGKASQSEFSGLSKLPVDGSVKRDIASLRHWTSLLVADLEAYRDGQFPPRTEGDTARHNSAAARLDQDFGVGRNG